MRKVLMFFLTTVSLTISSYGQRSGVMSNPSYRYYAAPGFVNITEITGATGLGSTEVENSGYYFGIANIFGFQFDRNLTGGAGIGFFSYENNALFPLYLAFRYCTYLRIANPYLSADCGFLLNYNDLNHGSKIFVNPGVGLARSFSLRIDGTLGAGLMIQMGDGVPRTSFINVKIGMIFRMNSHRMIKPNTKRKDYCNL